MSLNKTLGANGWEVELDPDVFNVTGQTNATTGATELVGPGGVIGPNFGNTTLSVGAMGMFATIQAAINYAVAQGAFTAITMTTNGAVSAWTQGTSTFAPSTAPQFPGSNIALTPRPVSEMWFKVADDTYYYPLEDLVGFGAGVLMGVGSAMNRVEASIGTAKALTWYEENSYTILLLDQEYDEALSVSGNLCVTIQGFGNTRVTGTLAKGAGCKSGRITFKDVRVGAKDAGGYFPNGGWAANTVKVEFRGNGVIDSTHEDFIHPASNTLGSLYVDCNVIQQPTAAQGHCIAPGATYGDIVVRNLVWTAISHQSTVDTVGVNNVFLVDVDTDCRNVVIDGVEGFIIDKFGSFEDVAIFGSSARGQGAENVSITNSSIKSLDALTADVAIVRQGNTAGSGGAAYYLAGNTIDVKSTTGAVYLLSTAGNPTNATTVRIGRGNNVTKCQAQANITYTKADSQASGAVVVASGATTVDVTHGLGYTPDTADIQITPTLLSNAAKFWITAVGATTFTINVDADPGAATATFAWRIAD